MKTIKLPKEFADSAISAEIFALNFTEIPESYDPENCEEAELLLYGLPDSDRKNGGMLREGLMKIYSSFGGGWWCATLNPDGTPSPWGCFKPRNPRKNADGKIIKYETPPKVPTQPFFLRVDRQTWGKIAVNAGVQCPDIEGLPDESIPHEFWSWVISRPEVPIIITEGAKKTASLLSVGVCAVGLSGIWNGIRAIVDPVKDQKTGDHELIPQLLAIAQKGREFTFCFDMDDKPKTKQAVRVAMVRTAALLAQQTGEKFFYEMRWDDAYPGIKGIDDLLAEKGEQEFWTIYDRRPQRKIVTKKVGEARQREEQLLREGLAAAMGDRIENLLDGDISQTDYSNGKALSKDEINELYRQKLEFAESTLKRNDPEAYTEVITKTSTPLQPVTSYIDAPEPDAPVMPDGKNQKRKSIPTPKKLNNGGVQISSKEISLEAAEQQLKESDPETFKVLQTVKHLDPEGYRESIAKVTVETTQNLRPHRPASRRIHGGYKNLVYAELYEYLEDNLGHRLSFDVMRREMYLDGNVFQLADELRPWFYSEFGEIANETDIYKAMVFLAKRNSIDPVVEDLKRCHREAKRVRIDNLAARYFGHDWESMPENTEEEIQTKRFAWMYNRCIEMWLISAVARQFETAGKDIDPVYQGCQADSVLILQGGQGKGKSQWFKYLSKIYFNDSISDIQSVNSLMAMHGNWIIELAEIDGITSKKDAATLKHYLTIRQDEFRVPYARKPEKHNRRSVFCGTVNPSRFLLDDENRRFWTVPVMGDIDLDLVKEERDGIWASAVDAYLNGAKWHPNEQEKEILKAIALEFSELDPWHESIESFMTLRSYGNANEILEDVFKFEPKDIGKREQMRVTKILHKLGYTEEKRIRMEGRSIRVKVKPSESPKFNQKVGNVGKSTDLGGVPDVPTPVPTPVPTSPRLVHPNDPTSDPLYQPNLSGVGTSENPSVQGIQGTCTDLPTKNGKNQTLHFVAVPDSGNAPETSGDRQPLPPVPEDLARLGYKWSVGQILKHKDTSRYVCVIAYPGIGSPRVAKEYFCQFLDGDESQTNIRQQDLKEV